MNYRITKVDEQTWRIDEAGVRFFLLAGTEKALMIDSGMEVHNAKEIAAGLTSLPVELLNTHADRDHIGSNEEFDWVYINPAELQNYGRTGGMLGGIRPVWDGDVLDLGGRSLEIIGLPGHTPGSIAVLDTGRRVLIGGDPVQDGNIFMFGPQRNLPAYYYSLKRLEQYTDRFDEIWPSHASCPVKPSLIGELIRGTERLVRGEIQPEAAEFHGVPVKRFDVGAAGLLCDADIRLPESIA